MNNSKYPCPICKSMMVIVGTNNKGNKIGSCGCTWSFKKTRSKKEIDRKYIKTVNGFELAKPLNYLACNFSGCSNPVSPGSNFCYDHRGKENWG